MTRHCSILFYVASALPFVAHSTEPENDRILVLGKKPHYLNNIDSALPVELVDTTAANQSGSVADLFTASPQVTFNGQGGLLQTVSIRGLSRWRIQTMVEGIPIHTERRAGNVAEFLAPSMIGEASVLSGAASTQLGSGALGGGIDMRLASSADTIITTRFGSQQDYRGAQALGGESFGNSQLRWGVSYRHANNGEDGLNQPLLNGFEQSVMWIRSVSQSSAVKDSLFLLSTANNLSKASSEPIDIRMTQYPDNKHWLAKVDFNWLNARIYAHHASLDTNIVRASERSNHIQNNALSWGASIQDSPYFGDWQVNWRLVVDARSRVKAQEQEVTPSGEIVFDRTNLDARQQAWSLSIDTNNSWRDWQMTSGIRAEHMVQHGPSQSSNDTSLSGFIGAKTHWSENLTFGLYLSSAFRTPSVTERFFSGNTPRGMTLGDPSLDSESAKNAQIDIDYEKKHFTFSVSLFKQKIDNYIERISLSPDLQQYVNLGGANIDGVNYTSKLQLSSSVFLRIQGQWLWGKDNNGQPINDVSPHQHDLKLGWQGDTTQLWLNMVYRQAHRRVGSSELPTPSVIYFKAGFEQALSPSLSMHMLASNLTDKDYAVSTDDLAPNAMGANVEVSLTYVF